MRDLRLLTGVVAALLLATMPQMAAAQSALVTGEVFGTVADPDGAVMPGALVQITNEDTGLRRNAVTDASGLFRFTLVPTGIYDVRADLAGFKSEIKRGVQVNLGSAVKIDFILTLSAIEEEIVVTAEAPVVEVSNPSESRGNTITAREILDKGAEKIERELKDQPVVQARLMRTIGWVYEHLGLYRDASVLLERAAATHREHLGVTDFETIASLRWLAWHYLNAKSYDDAERLFREIYDVERRKLGAEHVPQDATILTHCNAGALATGGYGTALGVIRAAHEAGKSVRVLADETRPYLQGARLTAWELHQDGIAVEVITDSMAAHFFKRGEIATCVVGSDRIAANGDVANKIGTYNVAVLAKEHGVPFTVAAPWSTVDLSTPTGDDIPIEERSRDEVARLGDTVLVADGIPCRHPAFDVTPARLVTAICTERGIVRPAEGETPANLAGG